MSWVSRLVRDHRVTTAIWRACRCLCLAPPGVPGTGSWSGWCLDRGTWGLGGERSRIGLPEQEAVSTRRERVPSSSKKGVTHRGR